MVLSQVSYLKLHHLTNTNEELQPPNTKILNLHTPCTNLSTMWRATTYIRKIKQHIRALGDGAVKCFANTLLKWLSKEVMNASDWTIYIAYLTCNVMFAKYFRKDLCKCFWVSQMGIAVGSRSKAYLHTSNPLLALYKPFNIKAFELVVEVEILLTPL